ncbi:MAG: multicopper oxidase domain-containing protein [Alphaproteobacteria bacterium]
MRILRKPAAWAAAALLSALAGVVPAEAGTYRLTVEEAEVTVDGRIVEKMTINGGIPGPTLRLEEGEDATIIVTNRMAAPTSVHWHGILLPGIMDGTPGFNGFMGIAPGESYAYTFKIRQSGTYWYHSHSGSQDQSVLGAIVIEPAEPAPFRVDRDHVVLLGDITAEESDAVLRNLKADPGYYNENKRTLTDFARDAGRDGLGAAVNDRLAWGEMRMDPTDLADVTGYAFLANGKTPEENETFLYEKGERIRLRLINGAAMTIFDVRIPGLKMTVVAADGNDVNPVPVDELRIGVAERYDVIVTPKDDAAYTLFAESIDRMGYARATLATRAGEAGEIPPPRPRTLLSMADMGMDHGAHAAHGEAASDRPLGWAAGFPPGAKVLGYDDLRALRKNADTGEPTRTVTMRLTGNMERYVWTLDDKRFGEAEPVRVRYGERVRLSFVNETMMAHPMHLHGQFFEVENGEGDRKPLKDTIIVLPGQSVSVVLTAREVGAWALHCHLLYHMLSGMMTAFIVEPPGAAASAVTPDGGAVSLPMPEDGGGAAHSGHGGH